MPHDRLFHFVYSMMQNSNRFPTQSVYLTQEVQAKQHEQDVQELHRQQDVLEQQ